MLPSETSSKNSYKSEKSVSKTSQVMTVQGKPYKMTKILADANIPYKLTMNRNMNTLFFCVNADEYSDQSFISVVLDMHTRRSHTIPSMRNGFASTVDHITNVVYLGGCDGIHKYSYDENDIQKTPVIADVDIFDLFFHKDLYYVNTSNQNLYMFRDGKSTLVPGMKNSLVQHFAFDNNDDLYFVNSSGVHVLPKGAKTPGPTGGVKGLNIRGVSTDVNGQPYFVAQDGIYKLDSKKRLFRVVSVHDGYGVAFDVNNHIVFSNERSICRLTPWVKPSPDERSSIAGRSVFEKGVQNPLHNSYYFKYGPGRVAECRARSHLRVVAVCDPLEASSNKLNIVVHLKGNMQSQRVSSGKLGLYNRRSLPVVV